LSTTSTVVSRFGRGDAAAIAGRDPNETVTPAPRGLLSRPWLAATWTSSSCGGASLALSPPGASLPLDGGRGCWITPCWSTGVDEKEPDHYCYRSSTTAAVFSSKVGVANLE
jgi:hypothetical protein